MFRIQISWDGLERVVDDETDHHTVHTSACARCVCVCVLCYSTEEEASSAKKIQERRRRRRLLKGQRRLKRRKHTNIMTLISSHRGLETLYDHFHQMHLENIR